MTDKLHGTAIDGFELHKVQLRPNNGMEIDAWLDDQTLFVLRVDSRAGHVNVSWDGRSVFDSGVITPLSDPQIEALKSQVAKLRAALEGITTRDSVERRHEVCFYHDHTTSCDICDALGSSS